MEAARDAAREAAGDAACAAAREEPVAFLDQHGDQLVAAQDGDESQQQDPLPIAKRRRGVPALEVVPSLFGDAEARVITEYLGFQTDY